MPLGHIFDALSKNPLLTLKNAQTRPQSAELIRSRQAEIAITIPSISLIYEMAIIIWVILICFLIRSFLQRGSAGLIGENRSRKQVGSLIGPGRGFQPEKAKHEVPGITRKIAPSVRDGALSAW
jgi:hypothetical protein